MKTDLKFIAPLAISLLLGAAFGQSTNIVTPNGDTTVIFLGEKYWTISELNAVALNFLRKNGDMPEGLTVHTTVRIYPKDPTTLCEFSYTQKFDRPCWTVKMGYDGKVQGFTKGIKKEERSLFQRQR